MKTTIDPEWMAEQWATESPSPRSEPVRLPNDAEQWRSRRHVNLLKILVPVDFTTSTVKALEYAKALAAQFGGTVCLLHVIERASFMSGIDDMPLWKSGKEVLREAQAGLEMLARRYVGGSVPVDLQVVSGNPGLEIPRAARETRSALVVLTTQGLHGWRHLFRRSTTQRVMRNVSCPVLLLHCAKPAELEWELDAETPEKRSNPEALRAVA